MRGPIRGRMYLELEIRPAVPLRRIGQDPTPPLARPAAQKPIFASMMFPISLGQAAQRRVRPEGLARGEPVGGRGIPAIWAGTVHTLAVWAARPATGRRGNTGIASHSIVFVYPR